MRIITGIYKGRHFDVPHNFKAAHDGLCERETFLFNVLNTGFSAESPRDAQHFSCLARVADGSSSAKWWMP